MKRKKQILARSCLLLGWREWVALPELGIDRIKAKLDTGARTSTLHAWDQEVYEYRGRSWVRFLAHPLQRNDEVALQCEALLADRRWVTNSGGGRERRNVIITLLGAGEICQPVELTLTNRDEMGFRMLIGREAMRGRFVVDPGSSYRLGDTEPRPGIAERMPSISSD